MQHTSLHPAAQRRSLYTRRPSPAVPTSNHLLLIIYWTQLPRTTTLHALARSTAKKNRCCSCCACSTTGPPSYRSLHPPSTLGWRCTTQRRARVVCRTLQMVIQDGAECLSVKLICNSLSSSPQPPGAFEKHLTRLRTRSDEQATTADQGTAHEWSIHPTSVHASPTHLCQ